jgi:hypothetical protein
MLCCALSHRPLHAAGKGGKPGKKDEDAGIAAKLKAVTRRNDSDSEEVEADEGDIKYTSASAGRAATMRGAVKAELVAEDDAIFREQIKEVRLGRRALAFTRLAAAHITPGLCAGGGKG